MTRRLRALSTCVLSSAAVLTLAGLTLLSPVPVLAQAATNGGGTAGPPRLSFDSKAPIEITADNLEVQDQSSVATFEGNVRVVQADMVLKSDTLEVHYKGKGMAGLPGSENSGAGDAASGIERINAKGHVFVTAKEDTAQSDTAVYEPDKGTVTMNGNVLLTRGKNILKGTQLIVDLKSGRSTLKGGGSDGRVKGVLVPEQKTDAGTATKP